MTRTARSKHWRRARVQQIQFSKPSLRGRRRGYRFSGASFPGARLDCELRKGNDIHSIRANPILLRSQDRPCLPLGIPFLEIARFRLAARSNEPRISAGTFQLAVLSPTGEPLCGSRTRESLDGVVGFQLGGRSIRGERRVPASPTVDSQTSKMKGGELSLEQVRVLPPCAAPRPHPWIRRFDKFAPPDKFVGEMTTL